MALSLYRDALRAARKKGDLQGPLREYARAQFDEHRSIDKKNYQLIEHLLRAGRRKLEMLSRPEVISFKF